MPSEKIQKTLAWLDRNGILYAVHYHPAIFTIEECLAYWKTIDAVHCKNLFMRNHIDNTASVVLTHDMFLKFLDLWGGEYEWIDCYENTISQH